MRARRPAEEVRAAGRRGAGAPPAEARLQSEGLSPRRLGVVAMIVLAVVLAVFGVKESVRAWQMRRDMRAVERELSTLRAQQADLAKTVDRLRTDPHYIEKLAREEMGMVREGETVLKFPSQGAAGPR
jgi:cell division protein FtsB